MSDYQHYLEAFQRYMRFGEVDELSSHLEKSKLDNFLSIYRNGFLKAAISALENNFPVLQQLLSHEHFFYLARSYVDRYPPSSATLVGYGMEIIGETTSSKTTKSFVSYLATEPSIQDQSYLFDVCYLDQAWLQTLNAQDDHPLTLAQVQTLIEQGQDLSVLPVTLVAPSALLTLSFDVFDLWASVRFSAKHEYDTQKLISQLTQSTNSILFWRQANQVQAKKLNRAEYQFFSALKLSSSLEQAENAALEVDNEFDLSLLFADLLNGHLLKLIPAMD